MPKSVKCLTILEEKSHKSLGVSLFLLQFPGIIYGERVAFNGARMGREEYFVIFDVLFSIHFIDDKGLIFASQILVFLDFLFECHNLL